MYFETWGGALGRMNKKKQKLLLAVLQAIACILMNKIGGKLQAITRGVI